MPAPLSIALLAAVAAAVPAAPQAPRATLAESCPTGMDDINSTVALHTHAAVQRLLDGANATLDIAVMYWSLLPESCGAGTPFNATEGTANADCAGFSNATRAASRAQRKSRVSDSSSSAALRVIPGDLSCTTPGLSQPCITQMPEAGGEARGAVTSAPPAPFRQECRCRHLRRTLRLSTLEIF